MKSKPGYMDKALKSRDPRFARVLSKMGYQTRVMVAETQPEPVVDEMPELRAEYEKIVGKRPFMGWDAETLREKIAAAKG